MNLAFIVSVSWSYTYNEEETFSCLPSYMISCLKPTSFAFNKNCKTRFLRVCVQHTSFPSVLWHTLPLSICRSLRNQHCFIFSDSHRFQRLFQILPDLSPSHIAQLCWILIFITNSRADTCSTLLNSFAVLVLNIFISLNNSTLNCQTLPLSNLSTLLPFLSFKWTNFFVSAKFISINPSKQIIHSPYSCYVIVAF